MDQRAVNLHSTVMELFQSTLSPELMQQIGDALAQEHGWKTISTVQTIKVRAALHLNQRHWLEAAVHRLSER